MFPALSISGTHKVLGLKFNGGLRSHDQVLQRAYCTTNTNTNTTTTATATAATATTTNDNNDNNNNNRRTLSLVLALVQHRVIWRW